MTDRSPSLRILSFSSGQTQATATLVLPEDTRPVRSDFHPPLTRAKKAIVIASMYMVKKMPGTLCFSSSIMAKGRD